MGIGMSVIHKVIEDVITVATYPKDASTAFLEKQIADCVVELVKKRTTYRHATAVVTLNQAGTITVKVELFDFVDGPSVAHVEYNNSVERPLKARKL